MVWAPTRRSSARRAHDMRVHTTWRAAAGTHVLHAPAAPLRPQSKNRMKLSWTCEEQLFQQELESSDDIRLSVRLFSKCMPDKRKFCKDVEPGNARAKDCLEEHRRELSGPCREEIDAMIEKRVRDLRLDSRLRSTCEEEIFNMCAFQGVS